MPATTCPLCDLMLTSEEAATGTCPSCQGRVAARTVESTRPRDVPSSSSQPRRRHGPLTWILSIMVALVVAACVGTGIFFAVLMAKETAWQRSIANDLKSLPFDAAVPAAPFMVPIRDKVLVWDCTNSTLSRTQTLLSATRRASQDDAAFTVILILKHHDAGTHNYSNGAQGITRTLTIGVVDFPDKKIHGSFRITGAEPPIMVQRSRGDTSQIVGDTAEPLKAWIETKGGRGGQRF